MRLDLLRVAVVALALGRNMALAPFGSQPRIAIDALTPIRCGRRSTRQSALNRADDTPAKVKG